MKKLTAIFLCIAIMLGMTTVFAGAINIGDTIEHKYVTADGADPITANFSYEGIFIEGTNTVPEKDEDIAYIFTVEKSGYYFIINENFVYDISEINSDGVAIGTTYYEPFTDAEGNCGRIYYLDEGNVAFLIYFESFTPYEPITIKYCGTEDNFENHDVEYLVESVEVENLDKYCVAYKYYDGYLKWWNLEDTAEKVTANFSDGTSHIIRFDYSNKDDIYTTYITLPNGRECQVYASHEERDDGSVWFVVCLENNTFIEEECEIVTLPFADNFEYFMSLVSFYIEQIPDYISWNIECMMRAENIGDAMEHLGNCFTGTFNIISSFFKTISEFMDYMF